MDENVEVIKHLVNAFNERNFTLADLLFAPDYVSHNPFPVIDGDAEGGRGSRPMRTLAKAIPDARAEIIRLVAKDDRVISHVLVHGRHSETLGAYEPTDNDVVLEFVKLYRIENGLIVEDWGLMDALDLMRQLGISPKPVQA